MLIIWIGTIAILVLYGCKILQLYAGWKKLKEFKGHYRGEELKVSIVIPVRNEEGNISKILNDITEQDYPREMLEIIIVNDHSADLTAREIKPFCDKYGNIRMLELKKGQEGKKAALDAGVKNSAGEIIITTDADCRLGKEWVSSVAAFYIYSNRPGMIIGLVDMTSGNTIFSKFQQFEFITLIVAGAGAAALSQPIFCSGANLIYKRELYLRFTDPLNSGSASGDDTLFLLKAKKELKNGIKVLKSKEALVYTGPQKDLISFFRQRIRWTSKSRYYNDFAIISAALIVFMANLALVISLVLLLLGRSLLLLAVIAGVKTITDFIFVRETFRFFNKRKLVKYLFLFQFVYPFYITITGILGNFISYSWKDRKQS